DHLLRDEGRPSPRRRHHHRSLRRRGAGRHPLRDAVARPLRRHRELPGLVRPLQHTRGGRHPCGCLEESTGFLRMRDEANDVPAPEASAASTMTAEPAQEGTPQSAASEDIARLTDEIVSAIKTVYDPEIPADVYELGLIYRIDIGDDRAVNLDM